MQAAPETIVIMSKRNGRLRGEAENSPGHQDLERGDWLRASDFHDVQDKPPQGVVHKQDEYVAAAVIRKFFSGTDHTPRATCRRSPYVRGFEPAAAAPRAAQLFVFADHFASVRFLLALVGARTLCQGINRSAAGPIFAYQPLLCRRRMLSHDSENCRRRKRQRGLHAADSCCRSRGATQN